MWGAYVSILLQVFKGVDGAQVQLRVTKRQTGDSRIIETKHTMSAPQLTWLRAGSALNAIRDAAAAATR